MTPAALALQQQKRRIGEMVILAYLSNISPAWPYERQTAALAIAVPGYPRGVTVFQDDLDVRHRRAHVSASLAERAAMMRPTTSKRPATIMVASLAVLDWSAAGLMDVLAGAQALRLTVRALDADLTILADGGAVILQQAVRAFEVGRRDVVRRSASAASAAVRMAKVNAGVALVADRWPLPSSAWLTSALVLESGVSRNSIEARLGKRPLAQKRYADAQARKAKR